MTLHTEKIDYALLVFLGLLAHSVDDLWVRLHTNNTLSSDNWRLLRYECSRLGNRVLLLCMKLLLPFKQHLFFGVFVNWFGLHSRLSRQQRAAWKTFESRQRVAEWKELHWVLVEVALLLLLLCVTN